MCFLLGANRSGMSILPRIVAGFEYSSRGRVIIHGEDVTSLPPHLRPIDLGGSAIEAIGDQATWR